MMTTHTLAGEWIDTLTRDHDTPHSLLIGLDDMTVAVHASDPRITDELAAYYHEFPANDEPDVHITAIEAPAPELGLDYIIKEREPGKTKIKEEYVDFPDGRIIRKRLTGMVFVFASGRHLAIGPCLENPNQVINFINNRHIQWLLDRGYLLAHAAGVANATRGLAMAGMSSAGKSSLALHLMSEGLTFISNDRLMLRDEGGLIMKGVAKLPRINPGTAMNNPNLATVMSPEEQAEAAKLSTDDLWQLEQKYDVFIDQCFGPNRFRLSSPMSGLVVLSWQRTGEPLQVRRVDLAERPDLLGAVMKAAGVFYETDNGDETPDFSPEAYIELLRDCPVFEFTGGVDFPEATRRCAEFLETGVMPE
jgi:HprK-related kinase B